MTTFAEFAPRYDVVLSDVWGVVHNGVRAHPEAIDALRRYRASGGTVVLITNSPQSPDLIIGLLDDMRVPRDAYDAVVSSGEATRTLLTPYIGKTVVHIGPPELERQFYHGLDIARGTPEQAAAVVVADPEHMEDKPKMYAERARHWLSRKLPMICANPDRVREEDGRLVYCGGAIADLYEAMGGNVSMAGKPYRPIYDLALKIGAEAEGRTSLALDQVLAIGDSVRTDAAGAATAGLDFLFITGSVHAEELDAYGSPDPEKIRAFVAPTGARLVGAMPLLAW